MAPKKIKAKPPSKENEHTEKLEKKVSVAEKDQLKRRSNQPAVCRKCKKNSNDAEWPRRGKLLNSKNEPHGDMVPIGCCCKMCDDIYHDGSFDIYGDFYDTCDQMEDIFQNCPD